MERLGGKIRKLAKEVRKIGICEKSNTQAAQIQYVNSVIMGIAQYIQPSICSSAFHAIDRRVNNTALAVWKKMFPKQYNQMQVPLKHSAISRTGMRGMTAQPLQLKSRANGLESQWHS